MAGQCPCHGRMLCQQVSERPKKSVQTLYRFRHPGDLHRPDDKPFQLFLCYTLIVPPTGKSLARGGCKMYAAPKRAWFHCPFSSVHVENSIGCYENYSA